MMEEICGSIIGIIGALCLFWCGYEVGKVKGLLEAEKMLDETIERAEKRTCR